MKTISTGGIKTAIVGMGIALVSVVGAGQAAAATYSFDRESDCHIARQSQIDQTARDQAAFQQETAALNAQGKLGPAVPVWPGYSLCTKAGTHWEYTEFYAQ